MRPRIPLFRTHVCRASRLTTALAASALVGLALNGAVALGAPAAQDRPDAVAFRSAIPAPGLTISIDEVNVQVGPAAYPRDLIDWIAFTGPDRSPAAIPEVNRVDMLQLTSGAQMLGHLVVLNREEVVFDTGQQQRVPFAQVAAILFCDTPCLVSGGVPVDPLVIATETARIAAAGGTVIQSAPAAPAPGPPAAAAIVDDPFATLRTQLVAPLPPAPPPPPPPTATPAVVPTATTMPMFPVPQLITGTPSATFTPLALPR